MLPPMGGSLGFSYRFPSFPCIHHHRHIHTDIASFISTYAIPVMDLFASPLARQVQVADAPGRQRVQMVERVLCTGQAR